MIPALKGAKLAAAAVKIYKDIEAKRSAAPRKIKAQETKPRWEINPSREKLQQKFRHAQDFGIEGNANNKTLEQYKNALQKHIDNPETQIIKGKYHTKEVTHYYNPKTKLNVIQNNSGEFISGWKLSDKQIRHIELNGKLGGGK